MPVVELLPASSVPPLGGGLLTWWLVHSAFVLPFAVKTVYWIEGKRKLFVAVEIVLFVAQSALALTMLHGSLLRAVIYEAMFWPFALLLLFVHTRLRGWARFVTLVGLYSLMFVLGLVVRLTLIATCILLAGLVGALVFGPMFLGKPPPLRTLVGICILELLLVVLGAAGAVSGFSA